MTTRTFARCVSICLLAAIACVALTPWATAAPVVSSPEKHADGAPFVAVDKRVVSVPLDGTIDLNVAIKVDKPTSYLESRLQLYRPAGGLLYQKTEIRHDVETGTVTIAYSKELAELSLQPGVYPFEIRVRSDASGEVREWIADDEVLVYDPEAEPTKLIVVARTANAPMTDPEGRFVVDPARISRTRDQVEALAALVLADTSLELGLALPPVIAEEWLMASQGYAVFDGDGVVTFGPESPEAISVGSTISLLRTALDSGRIELLDVPYTDPDPSGLQQTGRQDDLLQHYERGMSAYLTALEATPSVSTMLAGGSLTDTLASAMRARGKKVALVSSSSMEDTAAVYAHLGQGLTAVAIDDLATAALRSGETTTFARALFEHQLSEESSSAVVVLADLATGTDLTVADLRETLVPLAASQWIEMISPDEIEAPQSGGSELSPKLANNLGDGPPQGYWAEVADGRAAAEGLLAALGAEDPDASGPRDSSLVAQSALWAGRDGSWSLVDRGRAHAAAASRKALEILGGIRFVVNDVTLSSAQGDVPISITNPTEKPVTLTLRQEADGVVLPESGDVTIQLSPADNYLTLPVDLQSSLSGTVMVQLWAGDLLVDEAEIVVRASYLDRLVAVAAIAVILIGLLFFIRRRAQRADVDTIESE